MNRDAALPIEELRRIDPFEGFFDTQPDPSPLWGETARAMLDAVGGGVREGLYSYQRTLNSRSGPHVDVGDARLLMMSSYDYLGLIGHPSIDEAAIEAVRSYGTSTGGVRLLSGTNCLHRELERDLAQFKGVASSVVFTSGYLANIAAISAVVGPNDQVVIDGSIHRSVVDGCKLSRAGIRAFRHNDVESLETVLKSSAGGGGRTLIVAEGLYSMDGDLCPLRDLVALKRRYGALLMVDEAHSLGTCGRTGRGVDEASGVDAGDVDVWTGSLSKAVPSVGGYVAGARSLAVLLQHVAAPFVFSSALAPACAAAAREALRVIDREPRRLESLRCNSENLRGMLKRRGYDVGRSAGAVVPVILGDERKTWTVARRLHDASVYATPVVYPAVPAGAARLRLCAMATHTDADLRRAVDELDRTIRD